MVQTLPSPRRKPRHDEWTRPKMVAFLRELAACQSVAQAARSIGMSRQSAYRLRNRLANTPFSLGWEVALEAGLQQLAHAVLDRAVNGVEVPHFYHGEQVGTSRHYDERLSTWILDNPWKIGRHPIAREYSGEHFDRLLERIECASLDWEDDETLPGANFALGSDVDAGIRDQDRFVAQRSWYAANAAEALPADERR